MTTLQFIKSNLTSRATRTKVTGDVTRTIDVKHEVLRSKKSNKIFDFLGNLFKGFISGKIWELTNVWTNAGNIWNWLVQRVEQVKQFDWNASEKELESLMEAQNIGIATVWGSALGRAAGWLAAISVGVGVGERGIKRCRFSSW